MGITKKRKETPSKAQTSTPTRGAALVQERNVVSYELAGKLFRVSMISGVLGLCGVAIGVTGWVMQPPPKYFAVTDQGNLIPMQPLTDPVRTSTQVTNWVGQALTDALAIDFRNYRNDMARAEQYFTKTGFNQYIKAWVDSGNLDSVRANKYVVDATLGGIPVIAQEQVIGDRYYWRIRIPVTVGYYSANQTRSQQMEAGVTVQRVPESINPHGIAIHQIVMRSA